MVLSGSPSFCRASRVDLTVEVVARESYQTINDFDYSSLSCLAEINVEKRTDQSYKFQSSVSSVVQRVVNIDINFRDDIFSLLNSEIFSKKV